jgi:hypothetical protein
MVIGKDMLAVDLLAVHSIFEDFIVEIIRRGSNDVLDIKLVVTRL